MMYCKKSWLIILTLLLTFCKNDQSGQKTTGLIPVRLTDVRVQAVRMPVETSGILHLSKELILSFKTGGLIKKIAVDEGQTVKKGQLLASLDLSEIRARLAQAEARFEKAGKDWRRLQQLFKDSVATMEQKEQAKTAFELAGAELQVAKFNLKYSKIIAPWKGRVLKVLSKEQEMIAPGQPVILFGSARPGWEVKCGLTDEQVVRVTVGDSATLEFDALHNQIFKGQVRQVAGAADPQSATFETLILLEQPAPEFRSGFTVRVKIFPRKAEQLTLIPYQSVIQEEDGKAYVYRVDAGGRVWRQEIQIRYFLDDFVAVQQLPVTVKQVVGQGAAYLKPGSKVRIIR